MAEGEMIVAVTKSPGGYEARALGRATDTEADSLEELGTMVRDAVRCHFDEEGRPAVIRLHLVEEGDGRQERRRW